MSTVIKLQEFSKPILNCRQQVEFPGLTPDELDEAKLCWSSLGYDTARIAEHLSCDGRSVSESSVYNALSADRGMTAAPPAQYLTAAARRIASEAAFNDDIKLVCSSRKTKTGTTAGNVIAAVCEHYSITYEQITGERNTREIVPPRQIAMFLILEMTDTPRVWVARAFNKSNRAIYYATESVKEQAAHLPLDAIRTRIAELARESAGA